MDTDSGIVKAWEGQTWGVRGQWEKKKRQTKGTVTFNNEDKSKKKVLGSTLVDKKRFLYLGFPSCLQRPLLHSDWHYLQGTKSRQDMWFLKSPVLPGLKRTPGPGMATSACILLLILVNS